MFQNVLLLHLVCYQNGYALFQAYTFEISYFLESWLLCFNCLPSVLWQLVLWLFLTVPWVGLWCVIVVFPGSYSLAFLLLFSSVCSLSLRLYIVHFISATICIYISTCIFCYWHVCLNQLARIYCCFCEYIIYFDIVSLYKVIYVVTVPCIFVCLRRVFCCFILFFISPWGQ